MSMAASYRAPTGSLAVEGWSSISATAPATWGAADEVPLK